jgi:hypothetical protein
VLIHVTVQYSGQQERKDRLPAFTKAYLTRPLAFQVDICVKQAYVLRKLGRGEVRLAKTAPRPPVISISALRVVHIRVRY